MVEAEIVTPAPSLHKSRHKMDVEGDEPVYSTASSEMVTLHPSPAIDSTFLNFGKNAQKHDVPRWMPSCLRYRVRFLILFIGMVYLTSTRANELSFNFSVICMTSNLTVNGVEPLDITPNEVSIIFACIGVGALFFSLPLVILLRFIGARYLLSLLLFISAISTMMFSPMARIDPMLLAPLRLLQGLSLASVMTVMGEVTAQWAPISEIGKFMTFLSAASQFSLILTMPLSAILCVKRGWSSVFYVLGMASGAVSVLFFTVYRNNPDEHPFITSDEVNLITKGEKLSRRAIRKTPYREILSSKPVWAIWIAFLGNSFGFQLIVQFMPIYMNKILLIPIAQTGLSAFIPPVGQLVVKFIAVSICDRICISENLKLCIFNSIAMIGCGIFFLPLGFLSPNSSFVSPIICFTLSISCLGIVTCGSLKSAPMIGRQYTSFIMGVVQLVNCVGALLTPFLVSVLTPNNTILEWRSVFFCICFILIVTNIAFCMFCSADPQPWTIVTDKKQYQSGAESIDFPQTGAKP